MDRVARLDRAEQVLVPVDVEIGMVAALHQEGRAAERERLLDLLEDHRLRQDVALARIARPAVEGAEVAVRDADVRVVDVPVDDERDLVRVRLAPAHLVGRAARPTRGRASGAASTRVVVRQALAVERAREDLGDGAVRRRRRAIWSSGYGERGSAKRSVGADSMTPISAAIA